MTLSKRARARAVQLPAWNEALGLPRPWDQQWSLRMQQILAYETDLLEYGDIFDGSKVIARKVDELKAAGARPSSPRIDAMGGAVAAIDYMKRAPGREQHRRAAPASRPGEQIVVGVNRWTETEPSPLTAGEGAIKVVDPAIEAEQVERLKAWRASARRQGRRRRRWPSSSARPSEGRNIMEPSIACAKAGVTTGEWGDDAARGVRRVPRADRRLRRRRRRRRRRPRRRARRGRAACRPSSAGASSSSSASRASTAIPTAPSRSPCARATAAWRSSTRASASRRRRSCARRSRRAVHVVGLSILSGSHVPLVAEVMERMRKEGLGDVPVVVGGIIPPEDAATLKALRRRRRLHAQGLPAQRHHGRHREAGVGEIDGSLRQYGRPGETMREETRRKLERARFGCSGPRRSASALAPRP